ncbi:hypothetical protein [Lacihabitans soyangensis]|uniref:hypothetical protein n=1 Tax=Lacihabitans soyangensis TaxID=869394 RepID=UPI0020CD0F5A|nr:hypothetical protein [Lacihabitans soyangensis]
MRVLTFAIITAFSSVFISCASTAKFPVSSTVPAAEITAKKTQDKNKNYTIELTANNLASADRLVPAKKNYSVWIVTDENITKNIGQLNISNGKKTTLKTVTAFNVNEIFITAEDQGDLSYPMGTEISRTSFKPSKMKNLTN